MLCGGQGGLWGGEQAEEGGAEGPGLGLRLRRKCPPARLPARGVLGGDRADEPTECLAAPQVSSPVGCSAAAARDSATAPRFSAASSSPRLPRFSVPPSSSSLFPSPPTVLPLVLSSLSFPLLLPSSRPGRPCKVAPESPGSKVCRQPPAAAVGFLGCSLPGWTTRTTFALFWKQSLGFDTLFYTVFKSVKGYFENVKQGWETTPF